MNKFHHKMYKKLSFGNIKENDCHVFFISIFTVLLRLKIDLVSHSAISGGFGQIDTDNHYDRSIDGMGYLSSYSKKDISPVSIISEFSHAFLFIYIYIYHHHHVVPQAQISLTLSRHFSLSFITFGRSSGLHPVSSHSCCMYVRAGRPAFAWPYAGVHRSTSLMSSSLLLQQCPACLVRLTYIVFVMGGKWPYSWCLVGCCRQDLFNIALNILV